MPAIADAVLDLKRLDLLALGDTSVHRLDPRAKVVVTIVFIAVVLSFGHYEVARLLPFALFPAVLAAAAGIPAAYILRKGAVALPFALAVSLFNPLLDPAVVPVAGLNVSAGWLSLLSVVVRSLLAVTTSLVLVAVTGFPRICGALGRLGMPSSFVLQLLFLYRYVFVLAEEGGRTARARDLRSAGSRGMGIRPYASMVGHLFLRTWGRAERIHLAMLSRGFRGDSPVARQQTISMRDVAFVAGWCAIFLVFRFVDVPSVIGAVVVPGVR